MLNTLLRRLINDHDFIIICVIASQEMRLQNFQICIYNKVFKVEAILMHVKRFLKVDLFKLPCRR